MGIGDIVGEAIAVDQVVFTQHAQERFVQRSNKKYRHIDECAGCEKCERLHVAVRRDLKENFKKHDKELCRRFWRSKPVFRMAGMYRRSKHMVYRRHGSLTFVVDINREIPVVVTVAVSMTDTRYASELTGRRRQS